MYVSGQPLIIHITYYMTRVGQNHTYIYTDRIFDDFPAQNTMYIVLKTIKHTWYTSLHITVAT
jgi:hypothetical protein